MALPYDQITAMTHALIEDSAADNFFDSNPLFYWLKEKGQVIYDGGTHIQEPIVYDDVDAAGSFANYDILDTSPNEQHTAAETDIRRYYVNIVISRHELLRASGKQAVINLLDSKVQVGNLTMADQISTDLHSANTDSDVGIVGLQAIVKSTGTLHSIAPADAPVWASSLGTLSGGALTLRAMDDLWETLSVGNDAPKMLVTTRAALSKFKSLLVANQRFGEAEKVSGGFRAVMFNDVPVFADPKTAILPGNDHYMYFLNPSWLKMYVHRDDNFTSTPFPVTPNQDVVGSRLTASLQVMCNNRRMQGYFNDIDPTA